MPILYIYTVILKEVECENVTRCSIKWEEAVVKCIVYLLKDGKKCIYVQYIQYMYDVCIYLFYIYIYTEPLQIRKQIVEVYLRLAI